MSLFNVFHICKNCGMEFEEYHAFEPDAHECEECGQIGCDHCGQLTPCSVCGKELCKQCGQEDICMSCENKIAEGEIDVEEKE